MVDLTELCVASSTVSISPPQAFVLTDVRGVPLYPASRSKVTGNETSQASATFDASVIRLNMLSPKKARPSFTP